LNRSRSTTLIFVFSLYLLAACGDDSNPVTDGGGEHRDLTICFTDSAGLSVIEPDTAGRRLLILGDSLTSPRWSPNKALIAFERERNGPLGNQLRIVDSAGSAPVTLTSGILEFSGDPWSPDGMRLAVIDREYGLNIVTPSGPPPAFVLPDIAEAVFLSDSELVCARIVAGDEDRTEIVRFDLADSSITLLASDSAGTDYSPRLSHVGRKVAFARSEHGHFDSENEVWVLNADGTGQKRVAGIAQGLPGGRIRNLQFSDDGGSLALIADADQQTTIFVVRLGKLTVTDLHVNASDVSGAMSWSPDGKSIVFGGRDGGLAIVNVNDQSVAALSAAGSDTDW
jgi:dipeptidyl aminopeptidase/acylaminoacyl peptidase